MLGPMFWIVEKFYGWFDGEDNKLVVSNDEVLAIISLYWFTQSITSSARLYKENGDLGFSFEKIKLSWEISTLYNNNENLLIEFENLKDLNLKLVTQFHIENSPASIEKTAKETLGMQKKTPKIINYEK